MARIRSSIAGSVLAIAYALSPDQASAQQVSQVTYPTSQSSIYVCDNNQQRAIIKNPAALETVAKAIATGCLTRSRQPGECIGPLNSDSAVKGIRTGIDIITSVIYDLGNGEVTINVSTNGTNGFQKYRNIDPSKLHNIKQVAQTYCSQ